MQAQQAIVIPTRSFSTLVAVVATVVAAALALVLVLTVDRPATSAAPAVVTLHSVDGEQIAHNRAEEGLSGLDSASLPYSDLTRAQPSSAPGDQATYSGSPDSCMRSPRHPMAC